MTFTCTFIDHLCTLHQTQWEKHKNQWEGRILKPTTGIVILVSEKKKKAFKEKVLLAVKI